MPSRRAGSSVIVPVRQRKHRERSTSVRFWFTYCQSHPGCGLTFTAHRRIIGESAVEHTMKKMTCSKCGDEFDLLPGKPGVRQCLSEVFRAEP